MSIWTDADMKCTYIGFSKKVHTYLQIQELQCVLHSWKQNKKIPSWRNIYQNWHAMNMGKHGKTTKRIIKLKKKILSNTKPIKNWGSWFYRMESWSCFTSCNSHVAWFVNCFMFYKWNNNLNFQVVSYSRPQLGWFLLNAILVLKLKLIICVSK